MCPTSNASRPVILCPLEFERQALVAAGFEETSTLICTGPGRDNIIAWARDHRDLDQPVILAGLAGSLTSDLAVGDAFVVTRVVDEQGQDEWRPPIQPDTADPTDAREIIVTSTRALITGRLARLTVHRETGSMMIDLESTAFAAAARKYGWRRWGIVRGISDDLSTSLPDDIDQWVGETGHTRWGTVMRSLLAKPTLIPKVVELRNNSNTAMQGVAEKLQAIIKR